jgi:hypothetical protein
VELNEESPVHDRNGGTVSLREFIEAILAEREKALQAAFAAQQIALSRASQNIELRLDKLNELRQEVIEDRGTYLTREKYETEHGVLENKIGALEAWRGKALGFGALLALVSAAMGALIQGVVSKALGG